MKSKFGVLLKNIAHKEGFHVHKDATIGDAIKTMYASGKGVVVVIDNDEPKGIITERDIVRILYEGHASSEKAIFFASRNLVTIQGERPLLIVLNVMIDNNIRRIVVVDKKNRFLGVVNQDDLIRQIDRELERENLKVFHAFSSFRKLITLPSGTPLRETLRFMYENKISSVIITDEKQRALGIVTEKDVLRIMQGTVDMNENISSFMSSPIISVGFESDLIDVIEILQQKNIRRVVITDSKNRAVGIITERDILRNVEGSYSRFLENRLKSAKDMLNYIPEVIMDILDTGQENIVLWGNAKAKEIFGENLIDKPIKNIISEKAWESINAELSGKESIEGMQIAVGERYYEASGYYVLPGDNSMLQLILKDITHQVKLSIKDHLTGLYNRRYTEEFIWNEFEEGKRYNVPFSIVMIDLDNFKKVNDSFGHECGDEVLKSFSQIIRKNMRKADVIGRFGGEEFIVVMPKTEKEKASICMEKIRKLVEEKEYLFCGEKIHVTASFGISSYPKDSPDIQNLIAMSDIRLYRAKRDGKNRVVIE